MHVPAPEILQQGVARLVFVANICRPGGVAELQLANTHSIRGNVHQKYITTHTAVRWLVGPHVMEMDFLSLALTALLAAMSTEHQGSWEAHQS